MFFPTGLDPFAGSAKSMPAHDKQAFTTEDAERRLPDRHDRKFVLWPYCALAGEGRPSTNVRQAWR